ncbi:MAG: hypothetical protein RMJ82_09125 [Gemmatales bacterium]|nr:hypothetical protein [Gemmatales bacterium]
MPQFGLGFVLGQLHLHTDVRQGVLALRPQPQQLVDRLLHVRIHVGRGGPGHRQHFRAGRALPFTLRQRSIPISGIVPTAHPQQESIETKADFLAVFLADDLI